jgi:alpha-N-arabinofuranosidase
MEEYIETARAAITITKKKKRSVKSMKISFDEWGVWSMDSAFVESQVHERPWQTAPRISEQIYTMEDTLLFATMLVALLKNADIVKIGCQSLLTNISSCIMTVPGAESWVQPIYYPFLHMSKYGRGIVLRSVMECPLYNCERYSAVPYLDHAAVYNDAAGELVIFVVNRYEGELPLDVALENFTTGGRVLDHIVLRSDDKKATNLADHNFIRPEIVNDIQKTKTRIKTIISPLSWNILRISVE